MVMSNSTNDPKLNFIQHPRIAVSSFRKFAPRENIPLYSIRIFFSVNIHSLCLPVNGSPTPYIIHYIEVFVVLAMPGKSLSIKAGYSDSYPFNA